VAGRGRLERGAGPAACGQLMTHSYAAGIGGRAIVVASHPRSGTHLVIDLLRRQFPACEPARGHLSAGGDPYWNLDELLSSSAPGIDREIERLCQVARPLLKTHRRPDFFANCQYTSPVLSEREAFARMLMSRAATIFVHRNVVDVMISLYAMVDPQRTVPFERFIREVRGPLSRLGWWARHLAEWRQAERTLLVSYEELLHDPARELGRIAAFLGEMPVGRAPILPGRPASTWVERTKRLLRMRRESTALGSHKVRSDRPVLSERDMAFIGEEIARVDPALAAMIASDERSGVVAAADPVGSS